MFLIPVNVDHLSNDIQEGLESDGIEYIQPTGSSQSQTEDPGKVKYKYAVADAHPGEYTPFQYRNVRLGERRVRPEIYQVIQKLKATLHMS